MYTTLISAAQLQECMTSGQPLVVFDCSFDLMNPNIGPAAFEQCHIMGARYANLNTDLSAHQPSDGGTGDDAPASGGRHPLPARATFARWVASQGVAPHTQVVVYDRNGANYCGRLWWMLKWCGHEAVATLDGSLQAWQAMGGETTSGPANAARAAEFALGSPLVRLVDTATVLANLGSAGQTVLDARGAPRFRGEVEPMDPIAGHIPGALNRPFTENIGADGCFKPAHVLREELTRVLGDRNPATVVHQCGSGVSAVPNLLAMEIAGLGRQALYAGSWSEWSNTPGVPVERG